MASSFAIHFMVTPLIPFPMREVRSLDLPLLDFISVFRTLIVAVSPDSKHDGHEVDGSSDRDEEEDDSSGSDLVLHKDSLWPRTPCAQIFMLTF